MRILTTFCFFLFIFTCVFAAEAKYMHEQRQLNALEKETFATLKEQFPGELLDVGLETLHNLSESPEYLNFLAKVYPHVEPLKDFEKVPAVNFDNVLCKIVPSKKRYFKYYSEQFYIPVENVTVEVTDEEHFLVHQKVTEGWIEEAIKRGRDKPMYNRPENLRIPNSVHLLKTLQGRKMLKDRLDIDVGTTPKITPAQGTQIVMLFNLPLMKISGAHLDEDVRWIKVLFEKHGQANGLLWVALQDPILFARICHAFTTDTTFLNFVNYDPVEVGDKHTERLRNFRQRQQGEKQSN